jgi:sodium/pantothenate symporter
LATAAQVTGAWILILLYMAVILFFVIRGASRIKNISDYALGNILFSPYAVGLSLAAAMTSAATFVINPGLIANFGISGVISYGIALPVAAVTSLALLTKSFRKYGETVKALTLAQWIGKRYNSKAYSLFMAFLSLLLVTFIVLILVAIVSVISKAINADPIWVLTGVVVFVFGYMMFGGANSMVYTNTIQAIIMLVVAFILLGSGIKFFGDGIGGFFAQLREIDPALTTPTNPGSPLFRNFYEIIFAQVVVGIAIVVQPHIITKSLLLKKESDVNKFLVTAVVVELIFFFVVFAGLYARMAFPDLSIDGVAMKNDEIIPVFVVQLFAGNILAVVVGLVVVLGLMSAGMSTLEGLIQSVSTSITSDIIKPLVGANKLSDAAQIRINKAAIIALGVVAWFIARGQIINPNLSVAILAQNGVYAFFSAAFIPVIFGIFVKDIKTHIPFAATITAVVVHFTVFFGLEPLVEAGWNFGFFNQFLVGPVKNPAIASSTAIVISTLVAFILLMIQKKKKS